VFTQVWIAWANGSLHRELHGHHDTRAADRLTGIAGCSLNVTSRQAEPAHSPA
jgi:hypothetical protein